MEETRRSCNYCSRRLLAITFGPKDGPFNKRIATLVCSYCDQMGKRRR